MHQVAPGIAMIDTLLGGVTGVTAAYLVTGPRPALVDPGARTSAPVVREALAAAGLGPRDLRWIVLTHVHLDHCGATGILAAAFPEATVVVHRRGARHVAEPARLVAASAAVYGQRWSLYGGLDPTPAARIEVAEDDHRVAIGGGRVLRMIGTAGHARHHMSVLDEETGTVIAGDALGVRMEGGGLYPALPPSEIDLDAGDASLARIGSLGPARIVISHFGDAGDPAAAVDAARGQLVAVREAALASRASGDLEGEIARRLPLERVVGDAAALARWRRLGWAGANVAGVAGWLASEGDAAARQ
ncbi:MAG: MBL fold metallo-hydrolase [Thermoleophilia bacterium]|nr:MBL fold metallo-hydrolase [Thermoleophilia bacterium]